MLKTGFYRMCIVQITRVNAFTGFCQMLITGFCRMFITGFCRMLITGFLPDVYNRFLPEAAVGIRFDWTELHRLAVLSDVVVLILVASSAKG